MTIETAPAALTGLLGYVNDAQFDFTDEAREGLRRAKVIQGDKTFENDNDLKGTVRHLGGIGIKADDLPEAVIQKAKVIHTEYDGHQAAWATFKELDAVVVMSGRIRRYFGKVDNVSTLICGSNHIGRGAKGWSQMPCDSCGRNKKNFTEQEKTTEKESCNATVIALVYFPELDLPVLLESGGSSFMPACHWMDQLGVLSKRFAERPEIQAAAPGVKRVNSYFFKTKLSAGPFRQGDNGTYQELEFSKAVPPYNWDEITADEATVAKCAQIFTEMQEYWETMYKGWSSAALLSSPTEDALPEFARLTDLMPEGRVIQQPVAPVGLPGNVQKITVDIPAVGTSAVVVEPAAAPVTTKVALDDDGPLTAETVLAQPNLEAY